MTRQRNPKFEWIDALTESGIRPRSTIVTGMYVGNRWNGGNDLPYASEEHIAQQTGLSIRTVRRGLVVLQEEGWLLRVRRGSNQGGRGVASTWRPMFPTGHFGPLNRPEVTSQPARSDRLVDPSLDPLVDPPCGCADLTVVVPEGMEIPERDWGVVIPGEDPWCANPEHTDLAWIAYYVQMETR